MQYLLLKPESSTLPDVSTLQPFRCLIIIEEAVTPEWQKPVSDWLVKSGCLYMMAWGKGCEAWIDSIEGNAALESVTTRLHAQDSLMEAFWFAKHSAFHPQVEIRNTLLLHISNTGRMQEFLDKYAAV